MGAEGRHTLAGNSSLPFILVVCVKFPLALIHPHIQSPALSIHQSTHFVSADFIPALTARAASRGPPGSPPQPLLPSLLTETPSAACRFLLHRPGKALILHLIPITLLFTFSVEGNGRQKDTRTGEKKSGGGRGQWIMERDVCWIF